MDDKETVRLLRGIPKDKDGNPLVVSSEPATVDELKELYKIIGEDQYGEQSTN